MWTRQRIRWSFVHQFIDKKTITKCHLCCIWVSTLVAWKCTHGNVLLPLSVLLIIDRFLTKRIILHSPIYEKAEVAINCLVQIFWFSKSNCMAFFFKSLPFHMLRYSISHLLLKIHSNLKFWSGKSNRLKEKGEAFHKHFVHMLGFYMSRLIKVFFFILFITSYVRASFLLIWFIPRTHFWAPKNYTQDSFVALAKKYKKPHILSWSTT